VGTASWSLGCDACISCAVNWGTVEATQAVPNIPAKTIIFNYPNDYEMKSFSSQRDKRSKRGGKRQGTSSGRIIPNEMARAGLSQVYEPWMPLFPARTTRRLRYSTNVTLSSSLGTPSTYIFAANGLFDPDISGTGHQPMGFDQMMVSYNHYYVTGAHMTATFKNTGTNSPVGMLRVDANSVAITIIDQLIEQGMCTFETLEQKTVYGANKTLELSVSTQKFQGRKFIEDDPNLGGSSAANPIELQYFHVVLFDSASANSSCNVDIVIEFNAIFSEPRTLTESYQQMSDIVLGRCGNSFQHPGLVALPGVGESKNDFVQVSTGAATPERLTNVVCPLGWPDQPARLATTPLSTVNATRKGK